MQFNLLNEIGATGELQKVKQGKGTEGYKQGQFIHSNLFITLTIIRWFWI